MFGFAGLIRLVPDYYPQKSPYQLSAKVYFCFATYLLAAFLATEACKGNSLFLPQEIKGNLSANKSIFQLKENHSIKRSIKPGASHFYQVALLVNQYLHIVVDQLGVDVELAILAPDDRVLAAIDRPNGTEGPESVSLIADKTREGILPK